MATTQVYANGDGTTINFSFSFSYLKTEDIKVELQEINPNGRFISSVVVTDFTVPTNNPTQIQFNTLSASTNYQTVLGAPLTNHAVNPANTIRVKIYRETNDNAVPSTFFSGSAIRAQDLNNNFDQNLYLYQELENEAVKADGGVVTGNITFDQVVTINKVPSADTDAVNVAYLEQFVGGDSATVNTTRYREIATQGQTTVTVSPTFAVGNEVVFINGVSLSKFIEYSTPNGSTVVFTTALRAGDVIDVISYNNILVVSGDPSFDEPPFSRNAFIATAGQTVFVCTEEYTIGKEQVFLNGALLKRGVDYTAINKVNVTLTVAALVGDLVEVHSGNYFASGISSVSNSAYTYPGGVEQTVQARLEQYVSVKDFGAVGDGVTNDRPAIAAAITAAAATGSVVLFPPGIYRKAGTGGGQAINVPAGVKLVATGKAEIKSEGYPIFTLNAGCEISDITFNNLAGGVSIGLEIKGDDITIRDCTFQAGNQLIYLYTADRLVVDGCRFEQGCGYQVLQKVGFTSNDGRVVNCTSVDCKSDFVELNSEGANPCKNWLISGNFVKNLLNPGTPTSVRTECRFFGATATDGVIISNNVIDTIAGDSAIHCEGETKNLTVTGNLFIDCHSQYGKIFFVPNGTLVDSFIFSNNIIRYTPGFTAWTGESSKLIQDNGNSSGRHLISSNSFTNESAVVIDVMGISDTDDVVFSGNRVTGFNTVIQTGFGASGTTPRARKTVFFNNNILESCVTGLLILESTAQRHYRSMIDNNVFKDVTDVYTSGSNSMPQSLTGNTCRGSTSIDEGKIIGAKVSSAAVSMNWVDSDATSTRKFSQNYTGVNVAKTLFTAPSYGSWQLHVKCGQGSNLYSNNSTAKVVRLDYNSPVDIDLTEISTSSSGSGAGFTLALSGTSVTFTATATRAVQVTLVSSFYPNHTPDTIAS